MSAPLIDSIIKAENTEQRQVAADALAAFAKSEGLVKSVAIIESLSPLLDNKKSVPHREGGLLALGSLATVFGQAAEPFLIPQMPKVFELYSDKMVVVRQAAEVPSKAIMALPTRYAVRLLLPVIFQAIKESKWQSKIGAMDILSGLTFSAPQQISAALSDIIPIISETMWDSKPEVRDQATKTITDCFNVVGNPDLISSIPYLVGCINRPEEAADCIHQLAATTFVTTVEEPTLAIMCPLLVRGLAERTPSIQRQTAVIIDNMCKLVENPAHAIQFLPKLLPGLDRMIEIGASPELRSVAERARATLVRVGGGEPGSKDQVVTIAYTVSATQVLEVLKAKAAFVKESEFSAALLAYVSTLCSELIASRNFEKDAWVSSVVPYLAAVGSEAEVAALAAELNAFYIDFDAKNALSNAAVADIEEGELLCDCEFSLAYGGMILLNKTRLNLRRGQRYGLCGPNGVGKSTLMRAIADGQLEGFPPADELRTVFVEHNLQAEDADLPVATFIFQDEKIKDLDQKAVIEMLESVGFDQEKQEQAVGSLSGGWKMKLELARAMLMNADILLLDEPTNHLDVANVAWLQNYLTSLTNTIPTDGVVTKHPNVRVAYVAQHAFHHVEQHLDKTPNEYIRWRYQYGEDREMVNKATRQISPEEEAQMKKFIQWEINEKMEKLQIEDLYGRRKAKRTFEYEVQFVGRTYEDNAWIPREKLEEWGFEKVLQAFDDKEAAKAGAWTRSLTAVEVEKHLGDLGLDAEFATHNRIRGLSGGQKVKVVLAAAMWLNPHLLVLDEPTNYLDRDSLGALSEAIKEFGGGVVIISHNREFTDSVTVEKWSVVAGVLTVSGNNYTQKNLEKIVMKEEEVKIDAFGNVEKVKSTRKLSRKELKDKQKRRAAAKKRGEEVSDSEEDF
ncbi:hypothetical protein MVEG_00809 [Podila verticillata NRRL 6337]|nr:hypothetical protein MVEG_00809 [Podila verticillata NRRL 6337]